MGRVEVEYWWLEDVFLAIADFARLVMALRFMPPFLLLGCDRGVCVCGEYLRVRGCVVGGAAGGMPKDLLTFPP